MSPRPTTVKREVLRDSSFGERIAEDEIDELASYFVETDQWRRLFAGDVDVVYGPKGSGKSALYSLLVAKREELFDRNILIVPAENPSGQTAFANVALEPPTSEHEFIGLWKVYFLGLIARVLLEWGVQTEDARHVYATLEEAGLLERKASLQKLLRRARDYVKTVADAESVEGGLVLDPGTGMPMGVTGKITLRQPRHELQAAGITPIDELLELANEALRQLDFRVWLILDRLDVAFVAREELEHNALRALFKSYLDMKGLDRIFPKIFLRTDIWRRLASTGFREASHITRSLTITWERQSLLNLVMRRALKNPAICDYYGVEAEKVVASVPAQEAMLLRILPDQVDAGRNPKAFDWMLSRVQDGTGASAPRELIHLLSSLRESQLRRYEVGHDPPPGELLFDRFAFKDALKHVSEVRLNRTLFAEYPALKGYVEQLLGEKAQQTPNTLARIWGVRADEARSIADRLVEVGFFERRGSKPRPVYWVPFLYRDTLNLVQGEAKAA